MLILYDSAHGEHSQSHTSDAMEKNLVSDSDKHI